MKNLITKASLILILIMGTIKSWAQLPIPSMDVSLIGGFSAVSGMPTQDFDGINITGALNVHINERIAVGPFYSRGFMTYYEEQGTGDLESPSDQLMWGLNVRLSTSRSTKLRPYLNLNYFKLEMVKDLTDYTIASKTTGFGVGIGLMIKLNRNLYLNAIQIDVRKVGREAFDIFLESGGDFIIQAQTGISYNFSRKK